MCPQQIPISCHGCHYRITRRCFLQTAGISAAAVAGGFSGIDSSAEIPNGKVRLALVFISAMRDSWPYPGFDSPARQKEITALLREHCPQAELTSMGIEKTEDLQKVIELKDQVDGYIVHVLTLAWELQNIVVEIGQWQKPAIVVDEYLGGSGVFLNACSALLQSEAPVIPISTTKPDDLITVVNHLTEVMKSKKSAAEIARQCRDVYAKTFPSSGAMQCVDDPLTLTDPVECVKRFQDSRFLIVGAGHAGEEKDFLGAKGIYLDFDELLAYYKKTDRERAAEWAGRWMKQARHVVEPKAETVQESGAIYLAILELLEQYDTDNITMNCLGGFEAGKLPAYPCLGFMQLLDDGGQGVCEAMPDDTLSMMMARILTGRPGYVSDPVLDTSKNQIVYAHCVATSKAFGPHGPANEYDLRTLHNRDPRGACAQSFLPSGYMTTTFRTNFQRKQLVIHQAKSVGNVESECGCRTKLVCEVCGDIEKLFTQWSGFSWHRVTVYGDVKEPLMEFGKALGLEIVEEA